MMSDAPDKIREVTPYEKEKWYDDLNRFEIGPDNDRFIFYGDEWGEAFDVAARAAEMEDYGLSDWFVKAAEIQTLDMYYDQMVEAYYERNRDEPEDIGLPTSEQMKEKATELGVTRITYYDGVRTDEERKLWDWALDWREEHMEETLARQRKEKLEYELRREQETQEYLAKKKEKDGIRQ